MRVCYVLNSPDLTGDDVVRIAQANAVQLQRDVWPEWAALVERGAPVPSVDTRVFGTLRAAFASGDDALPIVFTRGDEDEDGDHSVDTQTGRPTGRVLTGGRPLRTIQITASHETIEATVDPTCNGYILCPDGRRRAKEPGDPVEADADGYTVEVGVVDVWLSNFVGGGWYGLGTGRIDMVGLLRQPYAYRPEGYGILLDENGNPVVDPPEAAAAKRSDPQSRVSRRLAAATL